MSATFSMTSIDPDKLIAAFENQKPQILDAAAGEMASLGEELVARMRHLLLAAETDTGLARVESGRGPHAGRYERGDMHDAIDFDIQVDGDEIVLRWGWIDLMADYFLIQEYGRERFDVNIDAVGSLGDSFTYGVTRLAQILRESR